MRIAIVLRKVLPYSLAVLVLGVLGYVAISPCGQASAAATYNLKAGGGEPGYAVNLFLPAAVTINTGDTVHWTFPWKEPHTVTFGQPAGDPTVPSPNVTNASATYDGTGFLSSGLQGPEYPPFGAPSPTTFDVKFTKAGTFNYFCAIHPDMKAAITVVDSGTPSKQADLDTAGTSAYTAGLAALKTLAGAASAAGATTTARPDGTKLVTLAVSSQSDSNQGDVQQFFPPSINITAGDSVLWKSSVHTPHTVTFGAPPPGDPFAAKPTGGPNFAGAANSGVIGIDEPNGTSFQLTFPAAGTFQYVCVLHANQAMGGQVVVAAAPAPASPTAAPTAAPGAPRTGSGVDQGESDAAAWFVAGAFIVAMAATATAFLASRR